MLADLLVQLADVSVAFAVVVGVLLLCYSAIVVTREGLDGLRAEWRDQDAAAHIAARTRLGQRDRLNVSDLADYRKARR